MTDLDALERLEQAATKQPWNEFRFMRSSREDALLIEAMRNALPALIAELRAARKVVDVVSVFGFDPATNHKDHRRLRDAIAAYAACQKQEPQP